jgi:hypothetical protein
MSSPPPSAPPTTEDVALGAVARSVPDIGAADGAGQNLASFGRDYALTLRNLAGPVRQLADLRSSLPRAALTAASDGQHQLEREAAQLPEHSDARSTSSALPAKSSARSRNTKRTVRSPTPRITSGSQGSPARVHARELNEFLIVQTETPPTTAKQDR